ncbi:CWF19 1 cell cycle control [Fasciola gigantica]|uniref:CWF19 1 cell cycle control n=1 Tax=Fasciola gigantica TaxID=46835 RepID=A0A504YRJ5_FASGI|nr:CWF19 1 cell cycle control [Fasciola gigantica]
MHEVQVHQKLLICGDVQGKIKALCSRVSKVMKSAGGFDMMFCVGDFFGNDLKDFTSLRNGDFKMPLPTYLVTTLCDDLKSLIAEDGSEICENLIYLGSKGMYTTVSGLRVVYSSTQSGAFSDDPGVLSALFSEAVEAENVGFIGVDLLLTSQWPSGAEKHVQMALPEECLALARSGSTTLARLAYFLRPRYHFCSGNGSYFERPPYRNHRVLQEKASHVTRFIALADVKNPFNRKYLYALKLVPIDKMTREDLTNQPEDVTENPYREIAEAENYQGKETEVQTEQYFYAMSDGSLADRPARKRRMKRSENDEDQTTEQHGGDYDPSALSRQKRRMKMLEEKLEKPREQAACWFCLGNPQVKKHLVVSVNTQAYLALPRGPLVEDHVLILTVGHHRSWTSCPDYVRMEIEDYKSRLKKMFADQGKAMVAFERNLKTQHYQLQVVPVPFSVAAEVKHVFLEQSVHSEGSPCTLRPIPRNTELSEICHSGIPYFYVELPTGERLFGQIKKDRINSCDIQFGRQVSLKRLCLHQFNYCSQGLFARAYGHQLVLCDPRILNCPEKSDWRNCTDEVEEETLLTATMRDKFAPYDID